MLYGESRYDELVLFEDSFKVRVSEVGEGGASVVAKVLVDARSLAPGGTPVAFTSKVSSFDGILISTNFFPASGLAAGGEAPTVLDGSGLGRPGSTDPYSTLGERGIDAPRTAMTLGVAPLRGAGYNVVTWDPRGQFNSGGKLQFDNPFFEGRDVSAVIDWISAYPQSALNGSGDPKVGMVGSSYGGTVQLTAASVDPRVDAIVPDNAWYSLLDSLYPEKTFKTARGSALLKSLRATGARVNGQLVTGISAGVRTGRLSPAVQAMLSSIGPTTLLNQLRAPTLLMQGVGNELFPLYQSIASAENIADNAYDTPIKLIWYGAGDGSIRAEQVTTLREATLAWLDQYVAGSGTPASSIPIFQWFDQDGGHYASNKLPFEEGFNANDPITINSEGGRLIIVPPDSPELGIPPSKRIKVIDVPVHLPAGIQIVGSPELTFTYRGRGTSRAIFAQLIDRTTGRVLGGATPLSVTLDGKQRTMRIPLADIAYTQSGAGEGHLALEIVGWVPDFANRSSGVITISDIQLDLPQRAQRAELVRR